MMRILISAILFLFSVSTFAGAAVRYIPGVAIVPEVRASDGTLRVYETTRGPIFWTPGYPIPHEDTIKLNVFVSTGGDQLEIVKVRLDNQEVGSLNSTPWSMEIPAAKLGTGYHAVEAWAKCKGKSGKSNSATLMLFIGPAGQRVPTLEEATRDPKKFALAIAGLSSSDPAPTISSNLPEAETALKEGKNVVLNHPVTLKIGLPTGKTHFVYSLVRNWREEYRSSVLTGDNQIRLQPAKGSSQGLLPGNLLLMIWATDKTGVLGQPATVAISVPNQ